MDNVKSEKNIHIILSCLLFVLISAAVFMRPLGNGDEIWNYNFAHNILHGRLPYADFNMIQTPFSAYLSAGLLWFLGDSLFAFRIIEIILGAAVFGLVYYLGIKIMKQALILCITAVLSAVLFSSIWLYDYNNLNLLIVLLLILLETEIQGKYKRHKHFIIGLLYGIAPLIKQSTGCILFLFNIVFSVWRIFRADRKKALLQIFFSMIPGLIFIAYLLAAGNMADFIDYGIHGIRTFTHRTSYTEYIQSSPLSFCIGIFPIIAIILSVRAILRGTSNTSRATHIMILLISVVNSAAAYPLCDSLHMLPVIVPYLICVMCSLKHRIYTCREKTVSCAALIGAAIILCIISTASLTKCTISNLKHFQLIPMSKGIEERIERMDNYITLHENNGQKVIIVDEFAAIYMIPAERYTKDFDMLLIGNLGTKSIKELLAGNDALFAVAKDDNAHLPQAHFELIHYIKSKYTKVDEVMDFNVYKKSGE